MKPACPPVFRGLAWRLAWWVLLFSLVVTAVGSAIQLRSKYLEFLASKERELSEIAEVNLRPLTHSLWNMDNRALALQVEGIHQLPDVEWVEVLADGKPVVEVGEARSVRRLERVHPLRYEFRGVPRQLGELRLALGLDVGWDRLWHEALSTVVVQTVRTMLLAVALLLIFYSMVARHLRRMAEHAAGLTVSGLETPLVLDRPPPGPRSRDELDQLAESFESMRSNLASSVGGLRAANDNLREEISRRQEAETELQTTRAYLQNMVDSMPSVIIGLSEDLVVTHFNAMATKLTGRSPAQAMGKPLARVFSPLAEHEDLILQAMRDGATVSRGRLRLSGGDLDMVADLVIYPLSADQGRGVVVRLDDETQQARMEEMLIQSEKMASLGSLAAGMAHEINNPLAGVLQNAQSLNRRLSRGIAANEKAALSAGMTMDSLEEYLEKRGIPGLLEGVRSSGERAARIVANMLKFARLSHHRHEPQNLAEIMDVAVELAESDYDLKKRYDFKRIRVVKHYASDLPLVPCSAQEVEQVVLNILKNAAQAMGSPGADVADPALEIALRVEDGHAVIKLRDNGPGMGEEVRKKVFEPFFTTKALGEGTGLGLSVSYYIITQNHGGTIEVDSAPGKGTVFTIRLPLCPPGPEGLAAGLGA